MKEWAGVISLLVAVAYTFPLGVWDRFFVSAEVQKAKEVDDLKAVVAKLTQLDIDQSQKSMGLTDPLVLESVQSVTMSTKNNLLIPNLPLVKKRYDDLTSLEMSGLAYELAMLGHGELADVVFQGTEKKARAEGNQQLVAKTFQGRAQLYVRGAVFGVDMPKVRFYEKTAIRILFMLKSAAWSATIVQAVQTTGDWALAELTSGDKGCGHLLARWVLQQAEMISPPGWAQQVQAQFAQAGYSQMGANLSSCPADTVAWNGGLPWSGPDRPD